MKRCPTCNLTFEENWLSFCTQDGTTLIDEAVSATHPPPPDVAPAEPDAPAWNTPSAELPPSSPEWRPPRRDVPEWQPPPPPRAQVQKQGLAVASLLLGIFSMTFGLCCGLGMFTALAGVVTGSLSLVQIKNDPATNTGKPLSIIGIILSAIYLVGWIIIFIFYGFAIFLGALNQ